MIILGLSFGYHDSSAALLIDGKLVAAAHEERFTRVKNDKSFPVNAIMFCIKFANLDLSDVDFFSYYENPFLKFKRILDSSLISESKPIEYIDLLVENWLRQNRFEIDRIIEKSLGLQNIKLFVSQHHYSHACSAYFASNFNEAIVLTIDGVGEIECSTISKAKNNKIEKIATCDFPNSVGLFYSVFTAYLGFKVNEGEYKVMGMAAYGKPTYTLKLRKLFKLLPEGKIEIFQKHFCYHLPNSPKPFKKTLEKFLGIEPREQETEFDPLNSSSCIEYANLAASLQKVTEEMVFHMVDFAAKKTNSKNLCIAGGVGLNSVLNGKLIYEKGFNLFVQPASGDSGASFGAALACYFEKSKKPRREIFTNPFLGKAYHENEYRNLFVNCGYEIKKRCVDEKELVNLTARLIAEGNVIGWFQGRSEWGPRSLGNRSILANPTMENIQEIVNSKIKFRELFRPFAPAVVEEHASDFMDLKDNLDDTDPLRFMLAVTKVNTDKIPSTTHADGSGRFQVVSKRINPLFHKLITRFGQITGCYAVLNTSFNLKGEPMVESPRDALRTFNQSEINFLVVGNYVISNSAKVDLK